MTTFSSMRCFDNALQSFLLRTYSLQSLTSIRAVVAERDFKRLQKVAEQHPAIRCIAISHSNNLSTRKWLQAIGGHDKVHVIVDDGRTIYAKWGLGVAGWTHMAPGAFWTLYMLARREGIRNRPTESGSRWQTAGNWAVDGSGIVRWGGPATRSDEEVNFEDAVTSLANVRTSKM